MPFIRIKSLPREPGLDAGPVLQHITRAFSSEIGVATKHVTVTWEYLNPGHYSVGGHTAAYQPASSHPLLVDPLAPDSHDETAVEGLNSCADF